MRYILTFNKEKKMEETNKLWAWLVLMKCYIHTKPNKKKGRKKNE